MLHREINAVCSEIHTKLYGEVNSVKKKHNYKIWLNDDVY